MEADAEHEQNDAEFRHLPDGCLVALDAGCEGAEGHARNQIAHNGRQAEPACQQAPGKGVTKGQCDVYEQRQVVHRCRKDNLQLRGRG